LCAALVSWRIRPSGSLNDVGVVALSFMVYPR
jgi:hypothetical protein